MAGSGGWRRAQQDNKPPICAALSLAENNGAALFLEAHDNYARHGVVRELGAGGKLFHIAYRRF